MGTDPLTVTLDRPTGLGPQETWSDQENGFPPSGTTRLARLGDHLRQPAIKVRLATFGALAGVTGLVATFNPAGSTPFPACPTRALFGVDCPACGGLRGTHALVNGQFADAFDYNLLLPLLLVTLAVPLVLWALPLIGRSAVSLRPPRWLVASLIVVFAVFSVVRNLPFDFFEPLAADLTR